MGRGFQRWNELFLAVEKSYFQRWGELFAEVVRVCSIGGTSCHQRLDKLSSVAGRVGFRCRLI